jgi:hypothetical protein
MLPPVASSDMPAPAPPQLTGLLERAPASFTAMKRATLCRRLSKTCGGQDRVGQAWEVVPVDGFVNTDFAVPDESALICEPTAERGRGEQIASGS